MKIGSIELGEKPLFLAPMEDVTDPSFRYICKQFGADVVYTEFISSDGLIRDAKKSLKKLDIYEHERPVGIQIYGHLIEPMVEAAKIAEAAKPDLIDINFGCPVRKIAARGAGSGMMNNVPLMVQMTDAIASMAGDVSTSSEVVVSTGFASKNSFTVLKSQPVEPSVMMKAQEGATAYPMNARPIPTAITSSRLSGSRW